MYILQIKKNSISGLYQGSMRVYYYTIYIYEIKFWNKWRHLVYKHWIQYNISRQIDSLKYAGNCFQNKTVKLREKVMFYETICPKYFIHRVQEECLCPSIKWLQLVAFPKVIWYEVLNIITSKSNIIVILSIVWLLWHSVWWMFQVSCSDEVKQYAAIFKVSYSDEMKQ